VHNSHYGLIENNVVYNTHGAGIVTEDGTESFNLFDHNFACAPAALAISPPQRYSGAGADPGGEGAGFWFRAPTITSAITWLPTPTPSDSASPPAR